MTNSLTSLKNLKRSGSEAYWSKRSAEEAAARLEATHDHLICAVDYTLYCDGNRDWTVHIFERAA